ncbi:PDZ domain-containing protein [Sphingomonas sp.]|uniref:PDZ domain-containing protein n=1 Tax=Sphingomonas sp. TaxID=28214 RepID=UPI003B004937
MVRPWSPRRAAPRSALLGIAVAIGVAASVAVLGEHGAFSDIASRPLASIPGVTLADDVGNIGMPVVTSLRSDGEAERSGLRVGDRIAAVDGHPVRDVAALGRAMRLQAGTKPLRLHVRRGDTVWTVAVDRAEPGIETHDPQDPAG